MGRVNAHITTAVCTCLLNCNLTCNRSHRDELLGHNFCALYNLTVYRNGFCFKVDFRIFKDCAISTNRNRFNKGYSFCAFQVLNHTAAD